MPENHLDKGQLEGNEGQDYARKNLVQLVVDQVNWKTLYRDPITGEYWKKYYPHSEMHGGGPPVFVKVSLEEAKREFKIEQITRSSQ